MKRDMKGSQVLSTSSFVAVFRTEAVYSIKDDSGLGKAQNFRRQKEPRFPTFVAVADRHNNIAGRVISTDIGEADQVYFVREGSGERVTTTSGSQAALDALVEVLRGHGYSCRRSSGS